MIQIPQKGKAKEEIFQTLESYKGDDLDWKSGRVMGYVYNAQHKIINPPDLQSINFLQFSKSYFQFYLCHFPCG